MQNRSILVAAAVTLCAAFASHGARAQSLTNLTTVGATVADGNTACPDQPYYLYSGGKPDHYAAPAEPAYPSTNLLAYIPTGGPIVAYDVPMADGRFGDSFNLQNNRSVCYAVIQFRAKSSNGGSSNDDMWFGHVDNTNNFNIVGQVYHPVGAPGVQSYALTPTGLQLLSLQTGAALPQDSIFDLYVEDDTELDFFRMYVWYGPNCSQGRC